MFTFITRYRL